MGTSTYSIAELAGDLREICAQTKDEREILKSRPAACPPRRTREGFLAQPDLGGKV
jgi:hypothetical protein